MDRRHELQGALAVELEASIWADLTGGDVTMVEEPQVTLTIIEIQDSEHVRVRSFGGEIIGAGGGRLTVARNSSPRGRRGYAEVPCTDLTAGSTRALT